MLATVHTVRPQELLGLVAGALVHIWGRWAWLARLIPRPCSGDRGLKLHNREISRSRTQPKVRKVEAWGLPCSCAECTRGRVLAVWHKKKRKGRFFLVVRKYIRQTRIVGLSQAVGGECAHRPQSKTRESSHARLLCDFIRPPMSVGGTGWRDPELRASSSWGCSVVGCSTTSPSLVRLYD